MRPNCAPRSPRRGAADRSLSLRLCVPLRPAPAGLARTTVPPTTNRDTHEQNCPVPGPRPPEAARRPSDPAREFERLAELALDIVDRIVSILDEATATLTVRMAGQ